MADQVLRPANHSFEDTSHIGGQIVHTYALERTAALSSTAHVNGDGLQPSGSEHARQVLKITAAAAGIREQHNRSAGPVNGAFERRAADFDVSVLLQSHSPATRLTLDAQSPRLRPVSVTRSPLGFFEVYARAAEGHTLGEQLFLVNPEAAQAVAREGAARGHHTMAGHFVAVLVLAHDHAATRDARGRPAIQATWP